MPPDLNIKYLLFTIFINTLSISHAQESDQVTRTIWNGPQVIFEKNDYADFSLTENQDSITVDVIFTRKNSNGLFNIALESSYNSGGQEGPKETQWALKTSNDVTELDFKNWKTLWRSNGQKMNEQIGKTFVVHLKSHNIYFDLTLLEWTSLGKGGGFKYSRSTPENILDEDSDGVPDSLDECPNTPSDEIAYTNGCSLTQTDSDGDGVFDDSDICPETADGESVDDQGCSGSQIKPVFWIGPRVKFIKYNFTDWNDAKNQDEINDNIIITRRSYDGIFNAITDTIYNTSDNGPEGTEWAVGKISNDNVFDLKFMSWKDIMQDGRNSIIQNIEKDRDLILHLIDDNIYLDIKFESWTSNGQGGGFSYSRSTPTEIDDLDGDGVPNSKDHCDNTPPGYSYTTGCMLNESDYDQDGVPDDRDECPNSSSPDNVDDRGCAPAEIWTGKNVIFKKENNADINLGENRDSILPNLIIARGNNKGLFNTVYNDDYNREYEGPANTEWAFGSIKTQSVSSLNFQTWKDAIRAQGQTWEVPGKTFVVHVISENIYFDVTFLSWQKSGQGGGFSYSRTTPTFENDQDNDGVPDEIDECPNTDENLTAFTSGCSESQIDDDNDGVPNPKDICPESPEGENVDENGCSSSQVAPTIWAGPNVKFIRYDYTYGEDNSFGDSLTVSNTLNRALKGWLFNSEVDESTSSNPSNTKWAYGSITENPTRLDFKDFNQIVSDNGNTFPLNKDIVLKLISENIFIQIKFLSWTNENIVGGGYSYIRSTANGITDSDSDGVADEYDNCDNSNSQEISLVSGCLLSETDYDQDGIMDHLDSCPNSLEGFAVDSNGCVISSVWNGKKVEFRKPSEADYTLTKYQDSITPNVILTRQNNRGLFNIAFENSYNSTSKGPALTEWAVGNTSNFGQLVFQPWRDVVRSFGYTTQSVDNDLVLHLIRENIYIDIKITQWQAKGSGGFKYIRSTPNNLDTDIDNDGVDDSVDDCICPSDTASSSTSSLCLDEESMSNVFGCSVLIYEDSDNDGVTDNLDLCPDTPEGESVDQDGCSESQDKPIFWTGPKRYFLKENNADHNNTENQDYLTDNVILTRQSNRGLFNIAKESSYGSTIGTKWAPGKISDGISQLNFNSWHNTMRSFGKTYQAVGNDMVLHLEEDNIYVDIKFLNWTTGRNDHDGTGGGFSYIRSTVSGTLDTDNDGIADDYDDCLNTIVNTEVDYFGCSADQLDTDSDGVSDLNDKCPYTPSNTNVNSQGCSFDQIPITIWNGKKVRFTKEPKSDGTLINNQDSITESLTLARLSNRGLFNPVFENEYDTSQRDSPVNTEWAFGTLDQIYNFGSIDPEALEFKSWRDAVRAVGQTYESVGKTFVVHIIDENIYFELTFEQWTRSNQGGGFSYIRSTPSEIDDQDGDGVADDIDLCPDTPSGEIANTRGCSEKQIDTDQDGIPDFEDLCPFTRNGSIVDEYGCSENEDKAEIWKGPKVLFQKFKGQVESNRESYDSITRFLWFARGDQNGLYNRARQLKYNQEYGGPYDTEWALGNTSMLFDPNTGKEDLTRLSFANMEDIFALNGGSNNQNILEKDYVVHVKSTNIYFDIRLLSYSVGGGFSYERSTPNNQIDSDGDGVSDKIDQCSDTISGTIAFVNGCLLSELDRDNDGVMDDIDLCPNTPSGETVTSYGCLPPILWTGPMVKFSKDDYADYNDEKNQDFIYKDISITRKENRGLYNFAQENEYERSSRFSPVGTSWAVGKIEDGIENLDFKSWRDAVRSVGQTYQLVDHNFVMRIDDKNIYIDFKFLNWTRSNKGGGYSYIRSTPNDITDTDKDGVSDELDQCPNTQDGVIANTRGCSIYQQDDDGDGVIDSLDYCPDTRQGLEVNDYGCAADQNSPMIWKGKKVYFEKPAGADWNLSQNKDSIYSGLTLTRGDNRGLFNIQQENQYNTSLNGPKDTEWAAGSINDDLTSLNFTNWKQAMENEGYRASNLPGKKFVVHQLSTNLFFEIEFEKWVNGHDNLTGGFSYYRTTSEELEDDDSDGVANDYDQCPDTPSYITVSVNGCEIENLDSDNDGVYNESDLCPQTTSGEEVDEDGCSSPILWTGPKVIFVKKDMVDWTKPENQDKLTDNYIFTRQNNRGLFNIAQETQYNSSSHAEGPLNTRWAYGDIEYIDQLNFMTWRDLMRSNGEMQDGVGKNMVVHLVQENIYLEIKFLSWRSGREGDMDGGFSYIRSTPNDILDDDYDGVANDKDICPDSEEGGISFVNGCTADENDEDRDGILDLIDECESTPFGASVDQTGCVTKTLWTGPNILFVKDDYSDWKLKSNYDSIVGNVFFTRQDKRGIFNYAQENSYNNDNPKDTEWALGSISEGIENLEFKKWKEIFRGDNSNHRNGEFVGKSLVVHLISSDIYFDLKFLSWSQGRNGGTGGGGFSYIRSTPLGYDDDDIDGVSNDIDECPNTPYGHMVYPNGCSPFVTDRDSDGVMDYLDECPSTPENLGVNNKGCPADILWTGPKVIFEKKDNANFSLAENQDKIIDEVLITRGDKQGLFNSFSETSYNRSNNSSPEDTRWAVGKIEDGIENLTFQSWRDAIRTTGSTHQVADGDKNFVMKIVSKNIFIDVKFLSWTKGNAQQGVSGGFSYERSTPYYENDQDKDGVPDSLDLCPDTPDEQTSYIDGCSIYQRDKDEDGVSDFLDLCDNTPLGDEVDENGCSSNQLIAQIWKGPKVLFKKVNFSDWRKSIHQDSLTSNYILTRDFRWEIFNIKQETKYNSSSRTPKNTLWAEGTTNDNLNELDFKPFRDVFGLDKDLVLFLQDDNIYLDIKFLSYKNNEQGGELSYLRSTPNDISDFDMDGVADEVDNCDNLNINTPVSVNGCLYSEMDNDNDGVNDDKDFCPDSEEGSSVDPNGCNYIIWNGPEIVFKKLPNADTNLVANTDLIIDGVSITRGDNRGLYNSSVENSYDSNNEGPAGTLWAFGKTSDGIGNLTFMTWRDAARYNGKKTSDLPNQDMVVWLTDHNIYFDLKFLTWDSGRVKTGGGFSYVRRTDEQILDSDNDGVPDLLDECSNTPSGTTVLQNGCPVGSNDSDNDGVSDNIDLCPNTPAIEAVDEYGCSTSQKSPILWTGKKILFEKKDHADFNLSINQDSLTSNVILTRKSNRGLFNIAQESSYGSTVDTEWAIGSIENYNINDLQFRPWKDTFRSLGKTHENVGRTFVMHMISDNIYVDIKLLHWTKSNAGGGFAYERGTPTDIDDQDKDGVPDSIDQCPNTPLDQISNSQGCATSQTDSDGDGVNDLDDLCPETAQGDSVDDKGCTTDQDPIILWTGKKVKFIKRDGADWLNEVNQDSLTPNVIFTRQDKRGLFNIAKESSYGSTIGTRWAVGSLDQMRTSSGIDPSKLNFRSWKDAMRSLGATYEATDRDMVVHLQDDNIFFEIKFLSWSRGNQGGMGGFSYIRTTPNEINDSDYDGVDDSVDNCICEIDPNYIESHESSNNYYDFQTPVVPNSTDISSNGLVIHLNSLDQNSYPGNGNTWYDLSGNENNFTIVGTPTYEISNGFKFEGDQKSKYFYLKDFDHPAEKYTDEYYIKTEVNNLGAFKAYNLQGNDNQSLLLGTENIKIFSRASIGNNNSLDTGINLNGSDGWHHLVRTSDRTSGKEEVFIDGKLVFSGKLNAGVSILPGGTMIIGNEMDDTFNPPSQTGGLSNSNAFDGYIPIYRLYSRVLTEQEILNNYNSIIEYPVVVSKNIERSESVSNSYVLDIELNEPIYGGSSSSSETLSNQDFNLSISGGSLSLVSTSPTVIDHDSNSVKLGLEIDGLPSGDEILIVTPSENSIYDSQGNAYSYVITFEIPESDPIDDTDTSSNTTDTSSNTIEYCDPEITYLVTGCKEEDMDNDFDGVPDLTDYCPDTPSGETVDENGCSASQNSPTLWLGKKVIFRKYDSVDWTLSENQDSLTSNVILTRQNKRGLFNIAKESSYGSTQDTEWSYGSIDDGNPVLNTYRSWKDIMRQNGQIHTALDRPMILHLITDNIYIDITFNQWTSGGMGGGLEYIRSTPQNIDDADSDGVDDSVDKCGNTPADITALVNGCDPADSDQDQDGVLDIFDNCPNTPVGYQVDDSGCPARQLWTGPKVIYKRDRTASWENDKDSLTVVTEFTRSSSGSNLLFNSIFETSYNSRIGAPIYSKWALGKISQISSLDFKSLSSIRSELGSNNKDLIGKDMVVHLESENIFFEIKFTSFSDSNYSFSYERSTPLNIEDDDNDGVDNSFDQCPYTPEDEMAFVNGCSENQKDQDQDGVIDLYDLCEDTPLGESVDENGCSDSQVKPKFWLGPNIEFSKDHNVDWTLPKHQDSLTSNVILTRQNRRGLFNIAKESSYGSTIDTKWAIGSLTSSTLINELEFMSWRDVMRSDGRRTNESVGINFIVHLETDNVYLNLKFLEWGKSSNGLVRYIRSTPSDIQDDDGDGIDNEVDNCPNTPEGEIANSKGCSKSQFDDDNDGVVNGLDLCPDTTEGVEVDENGCDETQVPPEIWSGKKVRFRKLIFSDWTKEENHDSLTSEVELARSTSGIFNISKEQSFNNQSGETYGVEWAEGNLEDNNPLLLEYTSWNNLFGSDANIKASLSKKFIGHLKEENIYFELYFEDWSLGYMGGGYTYVRTTPTNIEDSDSDGVADEIDNCEDSSSGVIVFTNGCSEDQEIEILIQEVKDLGLDLVIATSSDTVINVNDIEEDQDNNDTSQSGNNNQTDNSGLTNNSSQTEIEDFDLDGIPDNIDRDNDNDGFNDKIETICGTNPLDSSDFPPDSDGDNIIDCLDRDIDNDGVINKEDAFPEDSSEYLDTDGDGIGNNADQDDDGDGYSDDHEIECDSDPLRDYKRPRDYDKDLIPDCLDNDDDNDGCIDEEDVFPFNKNECLDSDGDGIGDNSDLDADNDGVIDSFDDFPLDPNESRDSDGDGIGDNADQDDNNDGFPEEPIFNANGEEVIPLFVSELLTPNTPGEESTWKIINIDKYTTANVKVYDGSGLIVYESWSYKNDWGGTNKNGQPLKSGPYYYIIDRGDETTVMEGWLYIFN